MNTKTTKFLAVLAVLAMAFASVAIITSSDSSDATATSVGGVKITDVSGLEISVDGDTATILGTAAASSTGSESYCPLNVVVIEIDVSGQNYTKMVVTDSAFMGLGNPVEYVTITGTELGSAVEIPMPTDGSSVTIDLYTGENPYVYAKTVTLDFADAFTQVTLNSDEANSIGYDEDNKPISYWVYTTGGSLTLNNYGGNEVFILSKEGGATVTIQGNNYLAFAIPDESTITGFYAGIYATTALTLTGTGNLSVEFDYGEDIIANDSATDAGWVGGIIAAAGITATGFTGDITIIGDGSVASQQFGNLAAKVFGIISVGAFNLGGTSNIVDVDIQLPVDENWAIGMAFRGTTTLTSTLYMNGTIVSGCMGMLFDHKVTLGGKDVSISASEAALKVYEASTLKVTKLNLEITDYEAHNTGENANFAITVKSDGSLALASGTVNADGVYVNTDAKLTFTETSTAILNVSGDYQQNPDSDYADFTGFYWMPSSAPGFDVYNAKPASSVATNKYTLLTGCDTYGVFKILNSSGAAVQDIIDDVENLTTDKLKLSKATTVFATLNSAALPATLAVPSWMTLIIVGSVTGAETSGSAITAGTQQITIANETGFNGTLTISKAGMEIEDVTDMAITSAKGSISLQGEITDGAIAAGTNDLVVTMEDGLDITELEITGTKATVTIPADADVSVATSLELGSAEDAVKSFAVAGTLVQEGDGAVITIYGNASVTGKVVGAETENELAIFLTLGNGSTLNVTGVVGYGVSAIAGTDAGSLLLEYATGFQMAVSSNGAVSITGALNQYGENDASATLTGTMASTSLTVGDGMYVEVGNGALTVNGTMTIDGNVNGGENFKIGTTKDSTVTVNGAISDIVAIGTTEIAMIEGDEELTTPFVTGYVISNTLSTGVVKISGKLILTETVEEIAVAQEALTIFAGALTMDNLQIGEYVTITVSEGCDLKGTVIGPGAEKASFNAKATASNENENSFTVTGGSLIIAGQISNIDDNTPAITVTGGTVTFGDDVTVVTLADDATVEVTGTATLELNGNFAAGTIDLKDKSELTGASNIVGGTINAAAGTSTDEFNTNITYADGAYVYYLEQETLVTYLCKIQTFDDTQYMAGVILYSYTGTGKTPLTEESIKTKAFIIGGVETPVLGAAIKKTVADAVAIVDDAVAITVATDCVMSVPVEVIPGIAVIELTVDGTDVTWDNAEYDGEIWSVNDENTVLTGVFDVSNKTDTFGVLPEPVIVDADSVFDKWVTHGETPVAYDPTIPMYKYTNALADELGFEPTVTSIYDTTYTVTFDSNGGSAVASQTVKYATKATEPDAPVKADYKFVAWYTEAELINKYNFRTAVTEDITLYAKWELDETVYASAVDIAVSKISGGVKVTVAGEDDLAVPAGTVTVKYAYWITIESTKILQWKSVDKTMTAGPIVNSIEVTGLGSAVFVEVSYASADGEVTGSTPRIVY